jgi:RimJ/RimL family protein N-acetyltransferase
MAKVASPPVASKTAFLETLVSQQCTRPEWRVTEGAASAVLWSLPGGEVPTHVVLIESDWDDRDAGCALMARVHERAAELGADALEHTIDSPPVPPQHQERSEARVALLEACGYALLRDGLRWLFAGQMRPADGPLHFRSLHDVGEEAFVDALAATFAGTLDAELQHDIARDGARGAAQRYLDDHRALEHRPEWWELGFTGDGALAGVIMGARNPTSAVIAYIGVVPEQRGRGLAAALVRRGTHRLAAAGATEFRADCDRDNVPMARAFARVGYEQFARRRSFRRDMAGSRG